MLAYAGWENETCTALSRLCTYCGNTPIVDEVQNSNTSDRLGDEMSRVQQSRAVIRERRQPRDCEEVRHSVDCDQNLRGNEVLLQPEK